MIKGIVTKDKRSVNSASSKRMYILYGTVIRLTISATMMVAAAVIYREITGWNGLAPALIIGLIILIPAPATKQYILSAMGTVSCVTLFHYEVQVILPSWTGMFEVLIVVSVWIWLMWIGVVERWKLYGEKYFSTRDR